VRRSVRLNSGNAVPGTLNLMPQSLKHCLDDLLYLNIVVNHQNGRHSNILFRALAATREKKEACATQCLGGI